MGPIYGYIVTCLVSGDAYYLEERGAYLCLDLRDLGLVTRVHVLDDVGLALELLVAECTLEGGPAPAGTPFQRCAQRVVSHKYTLQNTLLKHYECNDEFQNITNATMSSLHGKKANSRL